MRALLLGLLTFACAVFGQQDAWAGLSELKELFRGARATAMGGAFVSVADDEQAVFYNPAGLANIQASTFHFVSASLEASTDPYTHLPQIMSAAQALSITSISTLMG